MLDLGKPSMTAAVAPDINELTTGDLLAALGAHADGRLVFHYDGRDVSPGYHVTEVKDGAFQALDCGANPERWRETFIQLWDVPPENDRGFLAVGRFLAIMRKVSDHVPFDPDAKLTFEVSDGQGAIRLFRAESMRVEGEHVRIALGRRPASCKPRDRWLEQQDANACCGSSARA